MKPRELYRQLCEAANLDQAIADMTDEELIAVAEYITGLKTRTGIAAMVWGSISQALSRKEVKP